MEKYKHLKEEYEIQDLIDLKGFIKEYLQINKEVLVSLNRTTTGKKHSFVLYNFLERFYYSFSSIEHLIDIFLRDANYRVTINLLLRASILDFLTAIYLMGFLKRKNSEIDESLFIEEMNKIDNHFFEILAGSAERAHSLNEVTFKEKNQILQKFANAYPHQFDNIGTNNIKVKKMKKVKPQDMVKQIKKGLYSNLSGSYQLYKYYSQFEHCSSITKSFMYSDSKMEIAKMIMSFDYIQTGSYLIFDIKKIDTGSIERMKKCMIDFDNRYRVIEN